ASGVCCECRAVNRRSSSDLISAQDALCYGLSPEMQARIGGDRGERNRGHACKKADQAGQQNLCRGQPGYRGYAKPGREDGQLYGGRYADEVAPSGIVGAGQSRRHTNRRRYGDISHWASEPGKLNRASLNQGDDGASDICEDGADNQRPQAVKDQ